MAIGTYTRNALISSVFDDTIHANLSSQVDIQDATNRAVREVILDLDLRSMERISPISPNIFDDEFRYAAPNDLKDDALIDVRPQAYSTRTTKSRVKLVHPEEFDRKKGSNNLLVSVSDDELGRTLLIDIDVRDTIVTISRFDSLTGDGSDWAAFGNAENVELNQTNRIQGGASIEFDLTSGGTTAGVYNSNVDDINVGTDIFANGYAMAWVYINEMETNLSVQLRLGNDASNYHQTLTVGTDVAGITLVAGWNAVRWSWSSKTTVGTVDPAAIDYVALFINKTSGKSDDGYRFDNLQCHSGEIYEAAYYSNRPWQNESGSYLENSTSGTDRINAYQDEIDLIGDRVGMEISRRLRDWEQFKVFRGEYTEKKKLYKQTHPSRRLMLESISGYAWEGR